jgi:hypothetical protein
VFLQFNQLANCFHALEIYYKSKIKKNMLIILSLELLPSGGGICLVRETIAFLSSAFLEGADWDEVLWKNL